MSESVVSELFDKLGGIPRSVLHIPSKNAEQALQDDLDVIINAFSNVTDLFQIYKSMLNGTETTLFSSNLLHIVPSPDNYPFPLHTDNGLRGMSWLKSQRTGV